MTEPILIWGAGAIGGILGAHFVRAGRDVLFVDTASDHVAAIRCSGLSIEGPVTAFAVEAPIVTPEELEGTFRTVLLCVKAHHTEAAARALAPHVHDDGFVVSVQNGLNEEVLAEIVGAERVVGAFVNFGGDYVAPGRIHFGGRGAVVVGELDGRATSRVRDVHRLLTLFEPDAVATDDILGYLWGKLAYGAILFATALTNDSIADALARGEGRTAFVGLAREAVAVAAAEGIAPKPFNGFDPDAFRSDAPEHRISASLDAMVAFNRRSAKTHSGIWRDLAVRKRPTEVEAQLGAVVLHATRMGLDTPMTRATIAMVHEIEEGRRELSRANLAELASRASAGAS